MTSAQVENFSLSKRISWEREDNYGHAWQLMSEVDPSDIQSAIQKLKSGGLKIKVAFWLDNAEVIYSAQNPGDASAIEDFENCVAEQAPRPQ